MASSQGLGPSGSLDGLLANLTQANVESARMVKDTMALADRTAAMFGNVMDKMAQLDTGRAISHSVVPPAAAPSVLGVPTAMGGVTIPTAEQLGALSAGLPAIGGLPATGGVPAAHTPGKKGTIAKLAETVVPAASGRPAEHLEPILGTSFEEGRTTTVQGLMGRVAGHVNKWASSRAGDLEHARSEAALKLRKPVFDETGTAAANNLTATVTEKEMAAIPRSMKEKAVGHLKNVAGGMADGKGIGQALVTDIPVVGQALAAVGIADKAFHYVAGQAVAQRSANNRFQSVLGGANSAGFGERWQQNAFRLGLSGTMSGKDAEAIYKGGLDLYAGDKGMRNQYQGVATDLYRNLGMGPAESNQMMTLAAKNGNNDLKELAVTLKSVSLAAKDLNRNAADARQSFASNYQSTSQYSSGSTAVGLASQQTNAEQALGKTFSNFSYKGLDSDIGQVYQANAMHMNLTTFQQKMAAGGQGAVELGAKAKNGVFHQQLAQLPASFQKAAAEEIAKVQTKDAKGNLRAPTETQTRQAMSKAMERTGMSPEVIRNKIDSIDPEAHVTTADAGLFYGQKIFNPATDIQAGPANQPKDLTRTRLSGSLDQRAAALKKDLSPELVAAGVKANVMNNSGAHLNFGHFDTKQGVQSYLAYDALKTGNYNREGFALANQTADFKDSMFTVHTNDGMKSVDYQTLIRRYMDQVQSNPGAIQIIGGKHDGQNLSDALGAGFTGDKQGYNAKQDRGGSGRVAAEKQLGLDDPQKAKEFSDKHGGGDGTVRGKVTISPTDELRKYLKFDTSGSANMDRTYPPPPNSRQSAQPSPSGGGP